MLRSPPVQCSFPAGGIHPRSTALLCRSPLTTVATSRIPQGGLARAKVDRGQHLLNRDHRAAPPFDAAHAVGVTEAKAQRKASITVVCPVWGENLVDMERFGAGDDVAEPCSVGGDNQRGLGTGAKLICERHGLEAQNAKPPGLKCDLQLGFVRERTVFRPPAGHVDGGPVLLNSPQARSYAFSQDCQILRGDKPGIHPARRENNVHPSDRIRRLDGG